MFVMDLLLEMAIYSWGEKNQCLPQSNFGYNKTKIGMETRVQPK
jgi:hypothetical protein